MFKTFEDLIPDKNLQIFISICISLGIVLRSIPVIINICNLKGLMVNPIKRSSHSNPTPTLGGVSIFAGTLIGYMLWNFGDEGVIMHKMWAGVVILFFLGMKDDLFALSPIKKLISQIIASSLVVIGSDLRISNLFGIFGMGEIPYIVSVLFTIFMFVALINAFNLVDGIDGLAGGIGMIASGGFGLWFLLNEHWSLACLGLSLAASLAGFLRYNFSEHNKIFMGDTGSLLVGFITTILAVKFVHLNATYSFAPNTGFVSAPVIAVVMLIVPIFDTLRVFSIRVLRGKSPFKADRIHLHHLMVDNGLSHFWASFILCAATVFLTISTYLARSLFTNTQLCFVIILLFVGYLLTGNWLEARRLALAKSQKMDVASANGYSNLNAN
jgi:UDP-GlcNAc:undecaprenyl-phosphate/decaprenyl-phosphate GlcNAc-1-phosphate transferase